MASEVRNTLTWGKAIEGGWEPGHYQYSAKYVPAGTYEAILDFKVWAKKVMAINCYFTIKLTGHKIQLTVYCQETGRYLLPGGDIDFTSCTTQTVYLIEVHADQKKKIRFIQAHIKR